MQYNISDFERTNQLAKIDQLISQIENSNKGKDSKDYDYSNMNLEFYASFKFSGKKPIFSEMQARVYELHGNHAKTCMLYQKAAESALDVHNDPQRARSLILLAEVTYAMSTNDQFVRIDTNKEKVWTDIVCTGKDIKSALAKEAFRKQPNT